MYVCHGFSSYPQLSPQMMDFFKDNKIFDIQLNHHSHGQKYWKIRLSWTALSQVFRLSTFTVCVKKSHNLLYSMKAVTSRTQ